MGYGFRKPNILDIKLGTVLYDEDAPPDKKERMQNTARRTTSGETGIRLTGFQVRIGLSIDLKKHMRSNIIIGLWEQNTTTYCHTKSLWKIYQQFTASDRHCAVLPRRLFDDVRGTILFMHSGPGLTLIIFAGVCSRRRTSKWMSGSLVRCFSPYSGQFGRVCKNSGIY
jgi:Inositol polyphosphate kinase